MAETQDDPCSQSSPMMPQKVSYMEQDPMLAGCQSLPLWMTNPSRSYNRQEQFSKLPSCLIVEWMAIGWQCLVLL